MTHYLLILRCTLDDIPCYLHEHEHVVRAFAECLIDDSPEHWQQVLDVCRIMLATSWKKHLDLFTIVDGRIEAVEVIHIFERVQATA